MSTLATTLPPAVEPRCSRCRERFPRSQFYSRPNGKPDCYCKRCRQAYNRQRDERERRARNAKTRHQRRNARGDVWCNGCQRYRLPERFKRHPNRPDLYWWQCRDCTRAYDRQRYVKKTSTVEQALAYQEKHNRQRRRRRQQEQQARRDFVADAILTLRRRGLSKADVCRLGGFSRGSLLAWERKAQRPDPAVAARFVVLLRATAHLPLAADPVARGRWRPLPGIEQIAARVAPQIAAIPTRNSWRSGKRRRTAVERIAA